MGEFGDYDSYQTSLSSPCFIKSSSMTSEQSRSDPFELGCEAGEKMRKWSVHTFVLVFADVYESGGLNHLGSKIIYHFAGVFSWYTLLW